MHSDVPQPSGALTLDSSVSHNGLEAGSWAQPSIAAKQRRSVAHCWQYGGTLLTVSWRSLHALRA